MLWSWLSMRLCFWEICFLAKLTRQRNSSLWPLVYMSTCHTSVSPTSYFAENVRKNREVSVQPWLE